ncbi:MAG: hypothetical protein PUC32_03650 [Oscillospiraceae bacterium]|nr:hypothetical protein [Oscillospiraceae bacterium]
MGKKVLALLLAAAMVLSVSACGSTAETQQSSSTAQSTSEAIAGESQKAAAYLERDDWADDVKVAANSFMELYGKNSESYDDTSYVVFDFDNTCSIFDVEEQTAIYQLRTMSFAFTPEELPDILKTEIGDLNEDRTDAGYGKGSYQNWINDITKAYTYLYETYGPFTYKGLTEKQQKEIQKDPQWLEFATKMRAMYDLIFDCESASVAYPWVLYWFTGMTEDEVYDVALRSHKTYMAVETSEVTWTSPKEIKSEVGVVEYTWTSGTQVTKNIVELMKVLQENGIDVWICSASLTETIKAAVDAWGLHDYVTGLIAMTVDTDDNGKYVNAYNFKNGCGWVAEANGKWKRDTAPTMAQTQGAGKVTAINNTLVAKYGHGPIAGFMDSTGDFNFCTEYETLKLVICFNRASRKVTDGGGLIAEVAMYEKDTLNYDLASANGAGDTLYVLQGRDENGMRTLRNSNLTLRYDSTDEQLFRDEDNEAQLQYMIDHKMTVEDILNTFAIKTAEDDKNNPLGFKYGFLSEYSGYHSQK